MPEKLKSAEEWAKERYPGPGKDIYIEVVRAIQRDAIEAAVQAYYDAGDKDPDAAIRDLLPKEDPNAHG